MEYSGHDRVRISRSSRFRPDDRDGKLRGVLQEGSVGVNFPLLSERRGKLPHPAFWPSSRHFEKFLLHKSLLEEREPPDGARLKRPFPFDRDPARVPDILQVPEERFVIPVFAGIARPDAARR